MDSAPWI